MASAIRKKLDALTKEVYDEMDENQLKAVFNLLSLTTGEGNSSASEEVEEEEDEPVVKKGKKKVVEDDEDEPVVKKRRAVVEDDEEEEPAPKKKKKAVVEEDDEDEDEGDESTEEEDEDEEEEPAPKKKKKAVVEDDEEEGEEDGEEEEADYSSKSVAALKKLATEAGLPVKTILKKSTDEKKGLVKALKAFDETVALLSKKPLAKLLKLAEQHEVEYDKPRGRSGDDKKVAAAARALAAAGYPFE